MALQFTCLDRKTRTLRVDRVYAPRFLAWCYGSRLGRVLMDGLLVRPVVSMLYGWIQKQPWGRRNVRHFCTRMGINLEESVRPLDDFKSVNDVVTREIDLKRRPIDPDPELCIAPVDGRFLVYPAIRAGAQFPIKHLTFELRSFLRDAALATTYDGGAMAVARLDLADYHHFHFPTDGVPGLPKMLHGVLHAVSPYAARRSVPVFAENTRAITLIETARLGRIAMIEVGAFTVGSIRQCFVPGVAVAKGDRKGFFEFGASVVVLLFEPNKVTFDLDLIANSAALTETYLRLGEPIAAAVQSAEEHK
jgi:phosphatidylserine decarboxylase